MKKPKTNYPQKLKKELGKIETLKDIPDLIKDHAVGSLEKIFETKEIPNSAKTKIKNQITALKNIDNESIKNGYRVIYTQMCVLAVSALESILKEYLANALNVIGNINKDGKIGKINLTVSELLENDLRLGGKIGNLILTKEKVILQDLKNIKRTFLEYLNRNILIKDDHEKKICFYLECRHCIVHRSGRVDERFLHNTKSFKANIKNLNKGDEIILDEDDWRDIKLVFTNLTEEATKRR